MAESHSDYLERIRKGLQAGCGRDNTPHIFAELTAHLEDGIAERIARGVTREAAEQSVMASFGDADSVCAWYAEVHRRPSVWRASVWPLAGLALIMAVERYVWPILPPTLPFGRVLTLDAGLIVLIVFCYRSRRFTSGVQVLAMGAFFSFLLASFCLFGVPLPGEHGFGVIMRPSMDEQIKEARDRMVGATKRLELFEQGKKAFASKALPPEGVGIFHDARGYQSPIYILLQDPREVVYLGDKQTAGIFPTYEEARHFWYDSVSQLAIDRGKDRFFYISETRQEIVNERRIVEEMPRLADRPLSQNFPIFLSGATWWSARLLGFGLFADLVGGGLRMLVEAVRRRRRRTLLLS